MNVKPFTDVWHCVPLIIINLYQIIIIIINGNDFFLSFSENDDDCIDEGIDEGYKRWDDETENEKFNETKEFDFVLKVSKHK